MTQISHHPIFPELCWLFAHVFLFWQEDKRRKEEKDERKRKYNVKWDDEV